ncbi:MAG: GNAT family N-acetyltransferase [Gaiellaceae bacterium]
MIRPFTDADVDAAAEMLAQRHARHREQEPLLPADVDFRAQVESEWRVEGASGVISKNGYLFARPLPYIEGLTWMVSGIGGHVVLGEPEDARDLYAAAAGPWHDAGHARHAVFVPASYTALVDAWFRLSFGASAALATRETSPEPPPEPGLAIRRSTPDDLDTAARLDAAMRTSMVPAPSFSGTDPWTHDEYVEDWRNTWDEEQFVHFVAEREGEVVAHILLYRRPHDLRVPRDSIDLGAASTLPAARGSGAGRALTEHVLHWAHENGYPTMITDWRMTNLLASRFWPKRGFRATFLRLYRALP